jgi:hypothetical protein
LEAAKCRLAAGRRRKERFKAETKTAKKDADRSNKLTRRIGEWGARPPLQGRGGEEERE